MGLREELLSLSEEEREQVLEDLPEEALRSYAYDWKIWGRQKQQPPEGDWFIWLILAGRGWGKTIAGAHYVIERARQGYGPIALIGQSAGDVRDVMIELGDSSIMKISPPDFMPEYEPSKRRLTWPNGVQGIAYSGDSPNQLRGPQHATVWGDEPAKWRFASETWSNMEMGLRVSDDPRCVATTTPRPIQLIRELVEDEQVHVTRGSTYENVDNLPEPFRKRILERYEGTRLGRQELHAELLTDNPGALWTFELIDRYRVESPPELGRIVIGVDPSGGQAETGIVAAGVGIDGHGYVLRDDSLEGSSYEWARRVYNTYELLGADRVAAERNFGGEMVESTLRTISPSMSIEMVNASRGKHRRAEPVASLYEQGKIHHVGSFPQLEDEMTTWDPGCDWSPNRLDALAWCLSELMVTTHHEWLVN